MTANSCPQCHQPLNAGQWMCPSCGTPIADDVERTVVRADLPAPTGPPAGLITSVPVAGSSPGVAEPSFGAPAAWTPLASTPTATPAQPAQPAPSATSLPVIPVGPPPRNAAQKWLPKIAVLLALVGVGVAAWAVLASDDDPKAATDSTAVVSAVPTSVIAEDATSTTQLTGTTTTILEATTLPATTVPLATEPPPTTPARPPWPAPPIPDPAVFAGTGLAWAISDPLLSGMPSDQPTPYLVYAQSIFDKMAADDWIGAGVAFWFQPDGGVAVPFTFDQQNQWAVADRLSLLLVDAAPSSDPSRPGYDLRVAVVANFPDSASLLCGTVYSDPNTYQEVIQLGAMTLLADGAPPFMPETLLNDPAQIADLQARCA